MLEKRLELQSILEELLGSRNVYFQPPESKEINYPAIVYSRANIRNRFANDHVYMQSCSYQVTVMDADPDSEFIEKMLSLPLCKFDRHFVLDNLNHYVFYLYY